MKRIDEVAFDLSDNIIIEGDALKVLKRIPSESIDFIFTSPPYADNRKAPYQGKPVKQYVEWFLPITAELNRVLKPDGSFVLNIKERAVDGERQTYVLELILEMKLQRWRWVEEYIWHKRNSYPGKWPNRFRDAWERCLHFSKSPNFQMFQEAVMVPMGDWSIPRLKHLGRNDFIRHESRVGSGLGRKVANWVERDKAYPTNVIHLATESANQGHSATFPVELAEWFIRLFTQKDDLVLDPFFGSGTTGVAAVRLARKFFGVEIIPQFAKLAKRRLEESGVSVRIKKVS